MKCFIASILFSGYNKSSYNSSILSPWPILNLTPPHPGNRNLCLWRCLLFGRFCFLGEYNPCDKLWESLFNTLRYCLQTIFPALSVSYCPTLSTAKSINCLHFTLTNRAFGIIIYHSYITSWIFISSWSYLVLQLSWSLQHSQQYKHLSCSQ